MNFGIFYVLHIEFFVEFKYLSVRFQRT